MCPALYRQPLCDHAGAWLQDGADDMRVRKGLTKEAEERHSKGLTIKNWLTHLWRPDKKVRKE